MAWLDILNRPDAPSAPPPPGTGVGSGPSPSRCLVAAWRTGPDEGWSVGTCPVGGFSADAWIVLRGLVSRIVPAGGEVRAAAHDAEADLVLVEEGLLAGEVGDEEAHEGLDLVLGALPVLDGEGVEREVADAGVAAVAEDAADGLAAGAVALGAGEAAGLRPAAVAVHDDGDVAGGFHQMPTRRVDSRAGPMERMPRRPPESWMRRST